MVKALTYWDLESQIKNSNISPVYLFAGEEIFLKRLSIEKIKDYLFGKSQTALNCDIFYAEESNFDTVLETLCTLPFLGTYRLVILKNVEKFSGCEKSFISYLKKHSNKTILIMETQKKITDKFIKKIITISHTVIFDPLKGDELNKWVIDFLKNKHKKISRNAIDVLTEKIGNELEALINALNKLCLYTGDSEMIKETDIEKLIKKTRQDTRFMFLNALMNKKTSQALLMANELSRDGKDATDIIGLINWQFKRLENFKALLQKGNSQHQIKEELKLTPFVFNILSKQAANFSSQELSAGFELLLDSDVAIKQGLSSPGLALETLIVRLCLAGS
ncbi:MAG: DNA polymerase III subunit delta [Candidatus Omnitrophota bacterium]